MLTKEEADRFYAALGGVVIEKGCNCRSFSDWKKMQSLIIELTEKPKKYNDIEKIYSSTEWRSLSEETLVRTINKLIDAVNELRNKDAD